MAQETLEHKVEMLERQMKSLRRQVHYQEEMIDTCWSPWWKRLFWWFQGYRLYRLGRWHGHETIPPQHTE